MHTPFRVIPFTTQSMRSARRGHPAIPAGTQVFVIPLPGGGYFSYSYLSEVAAQEVAAKLSEDKSFNADFNRRHSPDQCLHTWIGMPLPRGDVSAQEQADEEISP